MALALVVLAFGSVVAGYAGFPRALGGSNPWERFLAPSFEEVRQETDTAAGAGRPDVGSVRLQTDAPAGETAGGSEGEELALMAASSVVAFTGIALAAVFFPKRRDLAGAVANRFAGVHAMLLNKYYVDEIYDAAIVQPIRLVSEHGLWKAVDARGIDGAVNGVGDVVRGASAILRRAQTGSVRAYAASFFLGVVAIVGYYLWR